MLHVHRQRALSSDDNLHYAWLDVVGTLHETFKRHVVQQFKEPRERLTTEVLGGNERLRVQDTQGWLTTSVSAGIAVQAGAGVLLGQPERRPDRLPRHLVSVNVVGGLPADAPGGAFQDGHRFQCGQRRIIGQGAELAVRLLQQLLQPSRQRDRSRLDLVDVLSPVVIRSRGRELGSWPQTSSVRPAGTQLETPIPTRSWWPKSPTGSARTSTCAGPVPNSTCTESRPGCSWTCPAPTGDNHRGGHRL